MMSLTESIKAALSRDVRFNGWEKLSSPLTIQMSKLFLQ
jgi:hypothetical protein